MQCKHMYLHAGLPNAADHICAGATTLLERPTQQASSPLVFIDGSKVLH